MACMTFFGCCLLYSRHLPQSCFPPPQLPSKTLLSASLASAKPFYFPYPAFHHKSSFRRHLPASSALPDECECWEDDDGAGERMQVEEEKKEEEEGVRKRSRVTEVIEAIPEGNSAIISACLVGLFTGVSVVLFNNGVHELRDFFWDGIPSRGASWLREEPISATWKRTILVPVFDGFLVGILNFLREALEDPSPGMLVTRVKAVLQPVLKSLAACITLGTGNSLGPEGPSVEIGSSVAKGIGTLFDKSSHRKVSLVAAGSAAGISSGFNAAVAGCFFAVESVLWPSPADSSTLLTNTTSMVILSAVIASVLSQIGLGSEPAFKVPDYDFRSPSELPLYLLLGILCGLVSLALSRCTSYMLGTVEGVQKAAGVPRAVFPVIGSFTVGLIALTYPEILYWGFENVDTLLESRPFTKGLPVDLLFQLVAAKIVATSVCRASGLVGGYYAPSLFIGAATGMAYGKFIALAVYQSHSVVQLPFLEVASPQAYGLVGMAATLAGVCQVPLISVLLMFELTQDYRIVLPLLGAVGLSSWVTSSQARGKDNVQFKKIDEAVCLNEQIDASTSGSGQLLFRYALDTEASYENDLCNIESSLCVDGSNLEIEELGSKVFVSQAMRTSFATVQEGTLLIEAVTLMLAQKQSYALIVDDENLLIGLLTLGDIQQFSDSAQARSRTNEDLVVADICSHGERNCQVSKAVTPDTDLLSADRIMTRYHLSQLPVVSEHDRGNKGHPVGVIDRDCILITCRAVAATERLNCNFRSKV